MNHFQYRGGALCCEDVALTEIAGAVGTPVYVYSTATLERHYEVFKSAFAPRDVLVAFAVKANANVAVLATLACKGAGADTVSQGEIERALKAGVPADKIIFSGVGKTEAELAFAVQAGVHQINVESIAELDTLSRIAAQLKKGPAIAIRVNPDVGAGGHEKISTGKAMRSSASRRRKPPISTSARRPTRTWRRRDWRFISAARSRTSRRSKRPSACCATWRSV